MQTRQNNEQKERERQSRHFGRTSHLTLRNHFCMGVKVSILTTPHLLFSIRKHRKATPGARTPHQPPGHQDQLSHQGSRATTTLARPRTMGKLGLDWSNHDWQLRGRKLREPTKTKCTQKTGNAGEHSNRHSRHPLSGRCIGARRCFHLPRPTNPARPTVTRCAPLDWQCHTQQRRRSWTGQPLGADLGR
jgi:hypothetical protein